MIILIASRPPAAIQGFRDPGLSTFNCFNVAASRARKRPREQPQPQPQPQPKDNHDNQNHNRSNQNQNPKQPQPEQPPPEQPPEEAEDDPWKIALRRHFRLVKYRVFEATRFQNIGLAANFEEKCSQTNVLDCLLYTSPSPRDATLSRMPSSA